MEGYKKRYNKGIEYFHNAISFSKSNKFGNAITLNVIGLSSEYLLSAILLKNGIDCYETGLQNILSSLESNHLIPVEIKTVADKLNKQCACSVSTNTEINTTELTDALRSIKQWVEAESKATLVL